ncbi:NAD(P)/FAD-dependent oxidoreductase [Gordonia sp. KTR9]|uniref:NAD(P)/FAD-dependent oxidoreductase n=1 Tax=Gordonia sp. KTR9 TaxID=337191 RepID=UPI00027DE009|nr:FAD-dependent oxidoreductase [Gordonia sp. KTR9]AFR49553.1 rubredoxin reductase [Gordonia sp. KTR9]
MSVARAGGPGSESVVIVGTGVAGITAAETLRTNGFDGTITVFGEEPHLPYRRTALSKNLVAGDLSDTKITLRPPGYWSERGIDIVTSTRVVDVDPSSRRVRLADVTEVAYDALVLATGGRARRLPGQSSPPSSLRTRRDAEGLREAIADGPVIIIGGGLIGLEIAAAVATPGEGSRVTVVERGSSLLSRVVPPTVAEAVATLHRERGVRILTGAVPVATGPHSVTLSDGRTLTGTVISAIGMEPELGLARSAGLPVDPAGIVVDDSLRTGVPGVYAAGDVAARPHPLTGAPMRAEQWLTATEHGRLVAMTIAADLGLNADTAAPVPRVPLAWTMQYSINIQLVGWPNAGDRVDVEPDDSNSIVRSFSAGRLVGAVCIGRGGSGRSLRAEIESSLQPAGVGG